MPRYLGPKNKLARREKIDLGLKTPGSHAHASLLRRLNILPGVHGQRRTRKPSDYGIRLREKQKAKKIYGLLERQFKKYYEQARKRKGDTGEILLQLLERRLDNVVFRLSLVPTRAAARQIITHGHVLVNGQKVTIPSYQIKLDDVVNLKQKTFKIPIVKKKLEEKNPVIPSWLERKGPVGKIKKIPTREDIIESIDTHLIVEFYSR